MPAADEPSSGNAWPAADAFRPIIRSTGVYSAGERLARGQPAARRGRAAVLADERVAELFRGPRFHPRRRPGGQCRLADPGDLAAVPGRHDGVDGGRGRPLPAESRAGRLPAAASPLADREGQPHERHPLADFLWIALVAGSRRSASCRSRPVFCFVAWRRSGYRRATALLELLRLAIAILAVMSSISRNGSRSSVPRRSRRSPCSGTTRRAWRRATCRPARARRPTELDQPAARGDRPADRRIRVLGNRSASG